MPDYRLLIKGAEKYRIALLCSEHDPLDCHRCLLVGRELKRRGVHVEHILSDGARQTHQAIEDRLLKVAGIREKDFFIPAEERISAAYRERSRRVAYSDQEASSQPQNAESR